MEIQGLSDRQIQIANIMWSCQSQAQVDACVTIWGHDALVVKEMLIAGSMDEINSVDIAERFLADIMK